MGKQTKKSGSKFGGEWTKEKITIIDDYLNFYTTALKNQKVKLVYIDAFAGSGKADIKDGTSVDGSAIKALQYAFDHYYFIEIDKDRLDSLQRIITERFPDKASKITIINDNCNQSLIDVLNQLTPYHRGVMFLDPYALELDWSLLESASKTGILDVWYLFPVNALARNLPHDKQITESASKKIDRILGTHEWETTLYNKSNQMSLFDEPTYERVNFSELVDFISKRLKTVFPYVSNKSRILKNSKNSPLFVLYFMMTNKSQKAINLGSKVVNQIFEKIDKMAKDIDNDDN